MTDDPREIRKYPNRRLYDVADSRYITLTEVQAWAEQGPIRVTSKKTGQDITAEILCQLFLQNVVRAEDSPVTTDVLYELVRGNSVIVPGSKQKRVLGARRDTRASGQASRA